MVRPQGGYWGAPLYQYPVGGMLAPDAHIGHGPLGHGPANKYVIFNSEMVVPDVKFNGSTAAMGCAAGRIAVVEFGDLDHPVLRMNAVVDGCVTVVASNASKVFAGCANGSLGCADLGVSVSNVDMTFRVGENCAVKSIDCSNEMVATGYYNGSVVLWDAINERRVTTLEGHTAQVASLQLGDGELVTAGHDSKVNIWDVQSKTLVGWFQSDYPINCVKRSAWRVVAGNRRGGVRVWNAADGQLIAEMDCHNEAITCMCLSDSKLYTGANDNTLQIWDLRNFARIRELELGRCRPVRLHWDGTRLFFGDTNGCLNRLEFGQ